MTWYITDTAAKQLARLLGHPDDARGLEDARRLLERQERNGELKLKGYDTAKRELWRHTRSGMRVVVERPASPGPTRGEEDGRVIWVGQGRPPERLWTPDDEKPQPPRAPDAKTTRTQPLAASTERRASTAPTLKNEEDATRMVSIFLTPEVHAALSEAAERLGVSKLATIELGLAALKKAPPDGAGR